MAATDKFMKRQQADDAKTDALVCLNCPKAECNGSAQCFREMKKLYQKEKGRTDEKDT
jgi:hypothetical protein